MNAKMWLLAIADTIVVWAFLVFFIPLLNSSRNLAAVFVALMATTIFVLIFLLLVKEWKKITGL